ncbi:hypothetical protein [Streptomyces aureoversilis]|uniref:Tetratricopeptide repeat protein n=1 Tax=Streptomyces aureoversilis TaxID=67277 RepID=A0ABW0AB26_9ACTN
MRRWEVGRSGWLLLAAVAVGVSAVSWLAHLLPGLLGGALTAVGAAVGAALSQRGQELVDDSARQAQETREQLLRDRRGRLPRICDVDDLIAVGIHPAAPAEGVRTAGAKVTPFVRRDQSDEMETVLRTHAFVLVVGESTAGKSRAAFEAARAVLPRYAFIAPDPADRTSLRAAVAAMQRERRSVLWLDDIERYLGADGLTSHALRRITQPGAGRKVLVLGTIRAQERARYSGAQGVLGQAVGEAVGEDGRPDGRSGRDVLAQAHEIRLDRRWTEAEVERARTFGQDDRIARAISSAERYGIAEYLAAGPQLLAPWQDAWAPEGRHARGAALVAAAVEARRAGWARPLPAPLLRELHERHLAARGGLRLRPEGWEEAVAWATTPLYATSSLLIPLDASGDSYYVFDYLPDAVDAAPGSPPILEDTWERLIAGADPCTCEAIGWEADARARPETAREAFRKALDGGAITAAEGLAGVFGDALQVEEACRVLRTTLQTAPADADPDALLSLRWALSWWSGAAGDKEEALAQTRIIHSEYRRRHGEGHRGTLGAAVSLARWTGATGRAHDALDLALEAQERSLRELGPEHRVTLACRFEVAVWTGASGQLDEAARLWGELDRDAGMFLGAHDKLTNDVRWNHAAAVASTGAVTLGLRILAGVVEGRAAIYGDDHPRTLAGRLELSGRTGAAGQGEEALALSAAATADIARALGHDHELALAGRHQQALWSARSGRHDEAVEQFARLLVDCERFLRANHPLTENCRTQLARPGQAVWYYEPPSW